MTSDMGDALASLAEARAAGTRVADEPSGKALLGALDVSLPEARVVASPPAAASAAAQVGWPVALKVVAPDLPHKGEAGGVAGPLRSTREVRAASERITRPDATSLLVERWEGGGVTCFVGLTLEGPFGPVVSFGLGGIWVEFLRDIVHRLAPIDEREATEMILATQGAPLLRGARGHPPVALPALASTIVRISQLAVDPDAAGLVSEVDVNPLLARPCGAPVALDATVILRPSPASP